MMNDLFKTPVSKKLTPVERARVQFDWASLFVKRGGFKFLATMFAALQKSELNTSALRKKALTHP